MEKQEVVDFVEYLKDKIDKNLSKKRYNSALDIIYACGNILYQTNIYYTDEFLEGSLKRIAEELDLGHGTRESYTGKDDTLLFWDGFGFNDRGLARIYINALCKIKKVVYVTYRVRQDRIPDIKEDLNKYSAKIVYIDRKRSPVEKIKDLNDYLIEYQPGHMVLYTMPNDVVATVIMYAYKNMLQRFQINLTDHAFWLGAGCIDRCIEFREYGARVSNEYRGIPKESIRIIPFYPMIDRTREFRGYPFEINEGQKVIFSGGELYKTLGENNKYYSIVEHILSCFDNIIFWYAGSGDETEIQKIIKKYPKRAYHTAERTDFFQVLEHVDVYLNTYPMCGGLMYQYAAMAGKVPVTLRYGDLNDGFLIDQQHLGIEFDNVEDLYLEIEKLLTDDVYYDERSKLMKQTVISSDTFDDEVRLVFELDKKGSYTPCYDHIDTEEFRNIYLSRITERDFNNLAVRKESIRTALKYYPVRLMKKAAMKCAKRIKKK